MKSKITFREFGNGAIRDTDNGKPEYYGFRHPLIEYSFAEYMNKKRQMPDGSRRGSNNWWGGWDEMVSLQSLVRHVEDLQALHAGLVVLEIRKGDTVRKVFHDLSGGNPYIVDEDEDVKVCTKEDTLNAIRFNAGAYLLEMLKKQTRQP
jgi:hypothetical protein